MRSSARALVDRLGLGRPPEELALAAILDLLDQHVYTGEVTADGHYVAHSFAPTIAALIGGDLPDGIEPGRLWESRIHVDDWPDYEQFNQRLLAGEDAEVTFRLLGLDDVLRVLWDRARPRKQTDGGVMVHGIISDVTARAEADARLAEASERFTRLLDVVGEHAYVALAFPDGRIEELFQGPGADRLLGGAVPDADMENWEAALHPDDRAAYDAFNRELGAGKTTDVEYRLIGADGITRWVHDRAATRRRLDGTIEISGIVSDVTERRGMRAELERAGAAAEVLAHTDALTGAANRRHFAEVVAARLDTRAPGGALLLVDADHFKHINDEHGHVVGDAVLIALTRRLEAEAGAGECLARWGGEEFALFFEGVTSDSELERRAERLRAAVSGEPVTAGGVSVTLTVSVGAVRTGEEPTTLDALIEAADRRLYAAKRLGRDRVSLMADPIVAGAAPSEPDSVSLARALMFAATARDPEREAHAGQVALLATLTAEHMQLAADVVLRCRLGGWLHDVGKLGIGERILEKADALDPDELAVIRTHPVVGADIVGRFAALHSAVAAVRHHHERYDGAGFPQGLAGDAIPIEARIVAAADAYAAMTADRPYSAATSPHEAAAELRRSAGSHLDPDVVGSLLDVLGPLAADGPGAPGRAAHLG